MVRLSFGGGVHPPECKATEKIPIANLPVPPEVVVPLSQHLGKPAKPVVEKKAKVLVGQVIGEADGFVSARVHSPVSGTVTAVEPHRHPAGSYVESVVIESDGEDKFAEFLPLDPENASPDDVRKRVREAGIVGLGGAAFPTAVKLTPPKEKPIDTLILNGCECEPYLTADHRLMLEDGESVARGGALISRVLGCKRWIVAVEDNKPDAVEEMRKRAAPLGGEVVVPHVKYPQGAEKQLIKSVLGREVPSGGLPMDVGVVVQNVGTAAAVFAAVSTGRPLFERVVTVGGCGVKEPRNVRARIGTPFRALFDFCGGLVDPVKKVLMGGPMMGMAQFTLDAPVIKGTSGLLALSPAEADHVARENCIRCGRCIDACPMGLAPLYIAKAVAAGLFQRAIDLGLMDCIECGCCSFACPAHRYLVQNMKRGKLEARSLPRK